MNKYFVTKPQVAGELGPATVYASRRPIMVLRAHFLLNQLPCDDLQETYPCFFATEDLIAKLESHQISGLEKESCLVALSDYVEEIASPVTPKFFRLIPPAFNQKYDISLAESQQLVVSERLKRILEEFKMQDLDFEEITGNEWG